MGSRPSSHWLASVSRPTDASSGRTTAITSSGSPSSRPPRACASSPANARAKSYLPLPFGGRVGVGGTFLSEQGPGDNPEDYQRRYGSSRELYPTCLNCDNRGQLPGLARNGIVNEFDISRLHRILIGNLTQARNLAPKVQIRFAFGLRAWPPNPHDCHRGCDRGHEAEPEHECREDRRRSWVSDVIQQVACCKAHDRGNASSLCVLNLHPVGKALDARVREGPCYGRISIQLATPCIFRSILPRHQAQAISCAVSRVGEKRPLPAGQGPAPAKTVTAPAGLLLFHISLTV